MNLNPDTHALNPSMQDIKKKKEDQEYRASLGYMRA